MVPLSWLQLNLVFGGFPYIRSMSDEIEGVDAPIGPGAITGERHVSLLQLITTPERFYGLRVAVYGYLHVKHDDRADLYYSKEHADYLMQMDLVPVDMSIEEFGVTDLEWESFDARHVYLVGTCRPNEDPSISRARIQHVERFSALTGPFYDGAQLLPSLGRVVVRRMDVTRRPGGS
jgi:hypothetical protein